VEAKIVRRLLDDKLPKQCGYLVKTSRGTVTVEQEEIFISLREAK